jgi:hypothetical protein
MRSTRSGLAGRLFAGALSHCSQFRAASQPVFENLKESLSVQITSAIGSEKSLSELETFQR